MYHRKIPRHKIATREIIREISSISRELKRQVALIITRRGNIAYVIVGDNKSIHIPDLGRYRTGSGRLNGLRCIHTHLNNEHISNEDITDMSLLGMDLMVSVQVNEKGIPGIIDYAHILPENPKRKGWSSTTLKDIGQLDINFEELIRSLEDEISRTAGKSREQKKERAILISVTTGSGTKAMQSLDELKALAASNELQVVDTVIQRTKKINPRFLMGKGRLGEIVLKCIQKGADLVIFDNELTPTQVKVLTDHTELRIIDRSQLILDIFSRRAVTREGKIQVELAQLKYLLPRLATKNTAMSRLTGGIGGRGPGETKLEINRRRARERIARLNNELNKISKQREKRRRLRNVNRLPIISIVGYTNAGKSTLLNTLTQSHIGANNRLFDTLDTSSRRLRFPREREVIITDTVGFIRDLPEDLMDAFAATLEELDDADLLLHVIDASSPRLEEQIKIVDKTLAQLDLLSVQTILVLNKADLLNENELRGLARTTDGVAISAIKRNTLHPLLERIENFMWREDVKVENIT
ncbi:GTPase HflX [Thermodesulfobacteriota bacterium]